MRSLCIRLEAVAREQGCFRAYEIAVGRDLFGAWLLEMTYGRVGTAGRTKARSYSSIADATSAVQACLRRRATAPRRIGVAYRLRDVVCEQAWPAADLAEPLLVFAPVQPKADEPDVSIMPTLDLGKT